MGQRKLAVWLGTGKNRVKRVMQKYGICTRRKRKTYVYPGKASQVAPNLLRQPEAQIKREIVFSDILEVRLAQQRPHEGLGNLSPQQFAEQLAREKVPSITLL